MHSACNIRMQWVCIEHKWCTGAMTPGQLRCPTQANNAVFTADEFSLTPLHPTPLPCQRKKKVEKPLLRAPLISPGSLCSTSFFPAIILPLLRSCQKFRGLRLSALVPHSTRLCLPALSSLHLVIDAAATRATAEQPPPPLSVASSESEMAFFCSKWSHYWALKFHFSPLTANSGDIVCNWGHQQGYLMAYSLNVHDKSQIFALLFIY